MSVAADNAALAASLVAALARGGVREAVVSPGSRSTPLALALAARPDVRVHVLVDERAAGFVALGLARATGDPVALLATSGTAGAHWYPAVIEAALSAVPLVLLTADRPPELQGCGAPQTVDQTRLFGAHVRAFAAVGPAAPEAPPGWAAAVAARLVDQAKGPPAGPVHLDVALREPLWAPGCEPPPSVAAPVVRRARARLSAEAAREALERLSGERGVIVAGPRCAPPGRAGPLAQAVDALSRALGWPVVCDALSGLDHVRAADALLRDAAFAAEHRPTHALRLGQVPTSKATQRWLADAAPETVLVDPDGQWHDPEHQAALLLVADPVDACYALARSAGLRPKDDGWLAAWARADRAARTALDQAARDGWWEGAVARAVVDALPPGALLVVASSLAVRDVDAFGGAPAAALLSSRGANGIDGTIATAAGAALAWTAGPVVALMGDLAFVHDLGGLAAARELEVPLTVVVVDNGGGAIFGQLPVAAHPTGFERLFLTPSRLDLEAAARGLGAEAVTVHDLPALREALARRGPGARVVRAPVDRTEGARRRDAAWAAVSRAWREPAEVLP